MSLETMTVLKLVDSIMDKSIGYRTVLLSDDDVPLFYDFDAGVNPDFKLHHFSRVFLETEIQVSKLGPGYHLVPDSCVVTTPVDALPELKLLFHALVANVTIPYCPHVSQSLTLMAVNGQLPYRTELCDALKSFYAVFDLQLVRALEAQIDTQQVGLVDCGVYDFSGNRAVGQNPELYVPLLTYHGFVAWIIFEVDKEQFRYRFGVRTSPRTQLIEIRPAQFDADTVMDILNFVCGNKNAV